jgi:hypothetical protein
MYILFFMPPTTKSRIPRSRVASKEVASEEPLVSEKQKSRFSLSRSTVILGILLVIAIGAAGYFYYQSKYTAQIADAKEIEELTKTIGQFLELPEGETPTLATVTDREKLADQTFFLKAENGDKVLIYSQGGKAILYRPSTKKIVDMTSVNINQANTPTENTPTAETSAPAPEFVTVTLYNGSTKVGLTDVIEKQVTAGVTGTQVTAKEKAAKSDYTETIIVDVSGKGGERVGQLAQLLGGTVGTLPEGETAPQTDILVIVGNPIAEEVPGPVAAPEEKKKN